MTRPGSLFVLFSLLMATSTLAQVPPRPIGVCVSPGLDTIEVESYCTSLPRCASLEDSDTDSCFMRCLQDNADDEESEGGVFFTCRDLGLVCHEGARCRQAPQMTGGESDEGNWR
jgi:hypothetical protein